MSEPHNPALIVAAGAYLNQVGIDRFRQRYEREPTAIEIAEAEYQAAVNDLNDVETQIAATQDRLAALQLKLERAQRSVDLRRRERDEADLAALSETFAESLADLSDVDKKLLRIGSTHLVET